MNKEKREKPGIITLIFNKKALYKEEDVVKLLLTAVGEDGAESDPAEPSFDYSKGVGDAEYTANAQSIDRSKYTEGTAKAVKKGPGSSGGGERRPE